MTIVRYWHQISTFPPPRDADVAREHSLGAWEHRQEPWHLGATQCMMAELSTIVLEIDCPSKK